MITSSITLASGLMFMKYYLLPLACLFSLATLSTSAQIRGKVYEDINANGHLDPLERGIAQMKVRVFDRQNQHVVTVTTDSAGRYVFPTITSQPLRVEFGELPTGFFPTSNQYLVRFCHKANETHDLGIYQPSTYVGNAPQVAISIQPLGDHSDPRQDSLGSASIRLLETSTDKTSEELLKRISPAHTGSIWGLAYDRNRHTLYSSALTKRHSGFGSLGSGGIYQTDLTTQLTRPLVSLDALGIPTSPPKLSRDLTRAYEGPMLDSLVFGWVGKMGLGGLDLSEDATTLYTINLFDGNVYGLRLAGDSRQLSAADVTRYALPKSPCSGGTFRPFAVKVHDELVYIGGVCDAAQSGQAKDLRGYVYALNPASSQVKTVLDFPLSYKRGTIEYGVGNWFAWTDDPKQVMLPEPAWWAIHPQPILSDLEFDEEGNLLLGLMDRLGHQMATGKGTADGKWKQSVSIAAGDVLRASPKRKTFRLENNAKAGERQSAGGDNKQGPAGGEFYYDDEFSVDGIHYHQENGMGGLALLPGSGQLLASSREPIAEYNSAGVAAYDNKTGQKIGQLLAYHHNAALEVVARKTNHVGDIELIGALPPTVLGHRVWQDCNENGQQDADETGLRNVEIELWQSGKQLATTKTDDSGYYQFDSSKLTEKLQINAACELRIAYQQGQYNHLRLTIQATNGSPLINNDAQQEQAYAVIRLEKLIAGQNKLDLDFGFACVTKPQASLQLACSGTDWTNAKATLSINGYQPTERYELTLTPTYTGQGVYTLAQTIPANGLIYSEPLTALTESDLSVRVFNQSGCYQDLFTNITQDETCVRLLTQTTDAQNNGLSISPNPTRDKVLIQYASKGNHPISLQVYSANSRLLQQQTLPGAGDGPVQTTLDLSQYTPGLYIISLQQGSSALTKRVIRY